MFRTMFTTAVTENKESQTIEKHPCTVYMIIHYKPPGLNKCTF